MKPRPSLPPSTQRCRCALLAACMTSICDGYETPTGCEAAMVESARPPATCSSSRQAGTACKADLQLKVILFIDFICNQSSSSSRYTRVRLQAMGPFVAPAELRSRLGLAIRKLQGLCRASGVGTTGAEIVTEEAVESTPSRTSVETSCTQATGPAAAPAELRSRLGLAIRKLQGLWRAGAALAPLLSLPAAAPLGVEPSSGASSAASDHSGATCSPL